MLLGHALTYLLDGRSMLNGQHSWMLPAVEASAAFLVGVFTLLVATALLDARIMTYSRFECSAWRLWPRLGAAQVALFCLVEHVEGTHAGFLGCAIQLAVAYLCAALVAHFTRLIVDCARGTAQAARYLVRSFAAPAVFAAREPLVAAAALAVCAGTSRFQRPPPKF